MLTQFRCLIGQTATLAANFPNNASQPIVPHCTQCRRGRAVFHTNTQATLYWKKGNNFHNSVVFLEGSPPPPSLCGGGYYSSSSSSSAPKKQYSKIPKAVLCLQHPLLSIISVCMGGSLSLRFGTPRSGSFSSFPRPKAPSPIHVRRFPLHRTECLLGIYAPIAPRHETDRASE